PGTAALMSFLAWQAGLLSLCLILADSCAQAPKKEIWKEFSGEKALTHVQNLVGLGPRPAGSEAIEKARVYIAEQLQSWGWTVVDREFTDKTPQGQVRFVDLVAHFGATAGSRFLLCSHYDTKIFDNFRFVGANDGGSSTGLLLEMARVLGQQPRLAEKVELVFFDGEEAFENFSETDGI